MHYFFPCVNVLLCNRKVGTYLLTYTPPTTICLQWTWISYALPNIEFHIHDLLEYYANTSCKHHNVFATKLDNHLLIIYGQHFIYLMNHDIIRKSQNCHTFLFQIYSNEANKNIMLKFIQKSNQ
jgi:hypothetical protein